MSRINLIFFLIDSVNFNCFVFALACAGGGGREGGGLIFLYYTGNGVVLNGLKRFFELFVDISRSTLAVGFSCVVWYVTVRLNLSLVFV